MTWIHYDVYISQQVAVIGDGRAGEETSSYERGVHVQMHPTSDLCKALI